MGKRGANSGLSFEAQINEISFQLSNNEIKPMNPTKQSREVFENEYRKLRKLAAQEIEKGNYDTFGYNSLDDEKYGKVFSRQALQGVQALINSEFKNIEIDEKLNVSTPEKRRIRKYALVMLNNMINRYYKTLYK